MPANLACVPYPTVGGIHFVLHQVAVRYPKAKTVAPESLLIDMRLVKQFEDSGFIRQLYPKGSFFAAQLNRPIA